MICLLSRPLKALRSNVKCFGSFSSSHILTREAGEEAAATTGEEAGGGATTEAGEVVLLVSTVSAGEARARAGAAIF